MNEADARTILAELGVGRVTRSRDWLVASCPLAPYLHSKGADANPSFAVKIAVGGVSGYNCKTCGMKGRLSGLVRALEYHAHENLPGLALKADLADANTDPGEFEDVAFETPAEPLSEAAYGNIYPPVEESREALDYLRERGIDAETAAFLDLRWDTHERRVLFVVRDSFNQLRGFAGRKIDEDSSATKVKNYYGLKTMFWLLGAERVDRTKPILVVEGLIGWAYLFAIGADSLFHIVAMFGTEMTRYKAEQLIAWGQPVYLLPDNDKPGETCLWGLPESDKAGAVDLLLSHIPVFVPSWPEWEEDTTIRHRLYHAGQEKDDPDLLTFADVEELLRCEEYIDQRG